jgi:transmembrane sensor
MSEVDWELLDRYLSGEATPEERARVETWLAEDPDRWAQVAELRDAIERAALTESAVEEAKAEVWARLQPEIRGAGQGRQRVPRSLTLACGPRWSTGAQIAAAIVLAATGGAVVAGLMSRSQPAPRPERLARTLPGQRATLKLPDGTSVILGVASSLRYPAAFGSGPRAVTLEGEAYFQVMHDERRPFSVRAGALVAQDLGTEFIVRAYPEDSAARVVVRDGKVSIRAAASAQAPERVVGAGQLGRLGAGREPVVEPADTALYFAWTDGRLVFDRTPLRDALPQLSRWFDLEFRLADPALGSVLLSATFRTQPTPDVLDNLAASLGMRQRRQGRVVTFYSIQPVR